MKGSLVFLAAVLPLAIPLLSPPASARPEKYEVAVLFWHDSPNDKIAFEGVKEGFALAGMDCSYTVENVSGDRDAAIRLLARWDEEKHLVYAMGTSAALLARESTSRVPVVFTAVTNPVESGVVASAEGSGTNLCGNTNRIAPESVLEVFKDAVPGLARLGVVYAKSNPVPIAEIAEMKRLFVRDPARRLKLVEEWIESPDDLGAATARALDRGAQALWVPIDYNVYRNLDRVAEVAWPRKIPLVTSQQSAVETHAVAGVAVDYRLLGRRSVVLARKVLLGEAAPGDLPVDRLRSYRVIANLEAARRTGVRLPLELLAIADRILDRSGED